ncbi:MAG: hypothetical protein K2G44_01945 [Clostridia bacterium]|nr:hypothetical protein [Clostridia bacterium]
MNWSTMQTHGEAQTRAFEIICNQLFDNWSSEEYKAQIQSHNVVNGAGGDGGVESFVTLNDGSIIGLQAKWFIYSLQSSQINQIKKSIDTAIKLRPKIARYIICLPRDLSNKTNKGESCEQDLWDNLINKLATTYPKVQFELWNDDRITKELEKNTSEGILKYWFTNSTLSYANIKFSFEKCRNSWLSSRYVPDLNSYGQIFSTINSFIGDNTEYQLFVKRVNNILTVCQAAQKHISDLLTISANQSVEIKDELNLATQDILNLENSLTLVRDWLLNSNSCPPTIDESIFYVRFENLIDLLDKRSFGSKYYFHASTVEHDLKKITKADLYQIYHDFIKLSNRTSILFLGEPGTGKTQGIAAVADKILNNQFHIAIVIQAKDITASQTWFELIRTNLGLSSSWNESELWQALVTTADQNSYAETHSDNLIISPRVLILVDGIDESAEQEKWIERINETRAIVEKYPRVRFCFTSRPYGFSASEYFEIRYLSPNGDVSPSILFDKYIKHYNIRIENNTSLKYQITTPLALKLFCELYANQTLDMSNKFDVSLSGLLQKKIDLIEESFSKKSGHSIKSQLVFRSITLLTDEFIINDKIEYQQLIEKLSTALSIPTECSNTLVDFLERYGILRCYCKPANDFMAKTYYYYPGIKGYFDYISSMVLLEKYKHPDSIDFTQCVNIDRNSLYGLAVISIQKYDYLLAWNKTINAIATDDLIQMLIYWSLQNAPASTAQSFKSNILEIMQNSSDDLISIVNNIVLPLSRNINHPLGISLLDEFLFSFDKPAQRDIIWSPIGYLKTCGNDKWNRRYSLELDNEVYKLNKADTHDGCPTVYAWALSSLNNTLRKDYRDELMRWALSCPEEYYKLFEKFAIVNDPQIRNDIFAIMMCLVYQTNNKEVTEKAYKWISKNVLAPDKIDYSRQISIRYYAMAIAHKANMMQLIGDTELSQLLPPYEIHNNDILLNREALNGDRMSGYSEIHYDLSRYVLVDNIEGSFDYHKDSQRELMNDFVNKICNRYFNINERISVDQFILSAAYAYIKNMGWDESIFYNMEKDENDNYIGGIDKDIVGTFYRADHGAQSNFMTVCEKYVWMARNEIYGFLCDRISLPDNSYYKDYGLIDDFVNPMQEIQNVDYDESQELLQWYIPQNFTHSANTINISSEDVIKSIKNMPSIQWKKWILCNNPQHSNVDAENIMALYSYNYFSEENVNTYLTFSTLIIKETDLSEFIRSVHNKDLLAHLHSIDDLLGGIATDCYLTPKEICWFPWKEHDDSWILEDIGAECHCAVDHCCYNLVGCGDCEMNLPSPYIREKLGISNTDGNLFYNSFNKIKAEYYSIGDSHAAEQQYLWVDKDELMREIEKDGNMLIWIMKIHRQESCLAREKFDGVCTDASQLFISYFKNDKFAIKKIFDTQDSK